MATGREPISDPISCFKCGTCCIAPDISTLKKPIGVPCAHLTAEHTCGIYPERPPVCRNYRPDELCVALQAVPREERVCYFLRYYDMETEAPSR
ncbi:MAG: hypothetical protein BWY76_00737 [bacterium ADurb.Bin429]|nr:MAG: hypothetical protein BWY76_00737 [bacterium ADurb.Bin429]